MSRELSEDISRPCRAGFGEGRVFALEPRAGDLEPDRSLRARVVSIDVPALQALGLLADLAIMRRDPRIRTSGHTIG